MKQRSPSASRLPTALLLLLANLPALAADTPTISIRISDDLREAHLEVPAELAPLVALDDSLLDRTIAVHNATVTRTAVVAKDTGTPMRLRLPLPPENGDDIIVADWHEWLLLPRHGSIDRPVSLSFDVPRDMTVALPFEPMEIGPERVVYRATPRLESHGGFSAIGRVHLQRITIDDMTITAALVGGEREMYIDWIDTVATAAFQSHGNVPIPHALIAVVPIDSSRGAVPWAHVRRGGGTHIIAYVNQSASRDALVDDWTLYHEMAHLYHPYLRGRDRWLSEGFASYFQYVYQTRAGTLGAGRAVDRLWAGFDRGRRENERYGGVHVTQGGRMRKYWTGAVLALELDTRLRRHTDDTLAGLMGRFAAKALPSARTWSADAYIEALDALLDQPLLATPYEIVAHSRKFPEPTVGPETARHILVGD